LINHLMKTKKPRHFEIYIPIYHLTIYVRLGGTTQQAYNYASKKLDYSPPLQDDGSDASGKFLAVPGKNDLCLWFKELKPSISCVVHEIFHAVCYIYQVRGIWPLTESNEEAFAYLLGDITRKFLLKVKSLPEIQL